MTPENSVNPKFRKFLFLCALFPNGGCAIATDYFTDAAPIWEATHSMQPRATCRTGKPCGNTCINISYTCNIGTASTSTTGITSFVPIAQTITFQSLPTISVGTNGVITANGGSSGYPVVFTSITLVIKKIYQSMMYWLKVGLNTLIVLEQVESLNLFLLI